MSAPENKPEGAESALEVESPAEETMTQAPLIEVSEEMDPAAMQAAYDASFKNMAEGAVVTGTPCSRASKLVNLGCTAKNAVWRFKRRMGF